MADNIEEMLSTIARYNWEYLYSCQSPICEKSETGLYLHLPTNISYSMAEGMADELRDLALNVDVLESEYDQFYLRIPQGCLEKDGVAILKNEAEDVRKLLNDRYRTSIEITPLKYSEELSGTKHEKLLGYSAVINLNELNLKILDASRYFNRDGLLPDPDSEEPLSTYPISEWQKKEPEGQLYMSDSFQINRGTSPISAIYDEFSSTSQYGLKVSNGKSVPGFDRYKTIFDRVLDSLVFTKKTDGSYDAFIVPQKHIIQEYDGYYVNGQKVEHALSGLMSLHDNEAIDLGNAARANEERPRFGIGIRENKTGYGKQLVIVIVQGGYLGCAAPNILHGELVEIMKKYKCRDAITLDGGGTATLIFQNPMVTGQEVITEPGDSQGYRSSPGCTIIR